MLIINRAQKHSMVLNIRGLLFKDIKEHLAEYRPDLFQIYPKPYLLWAINDSIDIASSFNIDDVYSMRLFVRLRWDIAPGFYKQAQIEKVLMQTTRTAEDRFNELATDNFAEAWEEAQKFNNPREWRTRFWEMET
jgi:hypothetical protein